MKSVKNPPRPRTSARSLTESSTAAVMEAIRPLNREERLRALAAACTCLGMMEEAGQFIEILRDENKKARASS